jgi:hypothetical protein
MPIWKFFNYAELTGRNKVREWLDGLSMADQARIDNRLLTMIGMERWLEKWVCKYTGTDDLYEFRIKGSVQYRPLGTYFGEKRYVILAGAVEKGDKIPKSDIQTAEERLSRLRGNARHAVPHKFDASDPLEEDAK